MAVVMDRELNGGTQVVHRFENGLGASVVRAPNVAGFWGTTYGYEDGLYELAVITFTSKTDEPVEFQLNYDTEITNDVLGHLTPEDVTELLARIEALEV